MTPRSASLAFAATTLLCALLPAPATAQKFRRAVLCDDCISDYYYVDEGQSRDWNCGNSTYSDHTGSDFSLRNGNFAIDNDNPVVAVAAGTVVKTEDGYYDRCTQCGGFNCGTNYGNGFANQVVINHGPYRVIYGHMKMGSIAVQMGDTVTCGQTLGFIGSSGCSTGAHLHVEPSLAANYGVGPYTPLDPFLGDCSPADPSFWVDQGAYRTLPSPSCDGAPPTPTCPAETYPIWTCTADGSARKRCAEGVVSEEACGYGCTVMPTGTDDVCVLAPDADGDGSRADVDCDDADPALHPGAVEVCGDGVDQECSGADLSCPMPVGGAGGSGTTQPEAGGQTGAAGAGGVGGQSAPPLDQAGQAAPPLGQAGAAGSGLPSWMVPAQRASGGAESGCSVTAPGGAGAARFAAWAAVLLTSLRSWRARARRRSCP